MHKRSTRGKRASVVMTVLAVLAALLQSALLTPAAQAATTNDLTLKVVSYDHPSTQITQYRWLVSAEDVGDPHQAASSCLPSRAGGAYEDFAPHCQWPSVRNTPGYVPIVSQGDQDDLNLTDTLAGLPDGRYLISVSSAGYQLGGEHFTVPLTAGSPVVVALNDHPLPLATLRLKVFQDNAPVDATYEAGAEDQGDLSGFEAHLADVLGEVTTDYYGNALCTEYEHTGSPSSPDYLDTPVVFDADGSPVVDPSRSTGKCVSDRNGDIVIRYLGSNRYASSVSAPHGAGWVQTTTLEGGHDFDVWAMANDTGLDTEMVVAGEPVPYVQFGFVRPRNLPSSVATGVIKGRVMKGLTYVGGANGPALDGVGAVGSKTAGPVAKPWVALSDLLDGDQQVYMGQGDADGTFSIGNVPDGSYQLTMWDEPQDLILASINVEVVNGRTVDVGQQKLVGWFTEIDGYVFVDSNANGVKDDGEQGIPGRTVVLRERDNSLMDQATNLVTTDSNGHYSIKEAYPLSKWLVLEHFDPLFEGTGVTVQADNAPSGTTYLGGAVDINVLPIIGLGGRVDWGVRPYARGTNGGIAGTITYDVTRNETDPRFSAAEDYQPGVPDIPVSLFAPVPCDTPGEGSCSDDGYAIAADGSLAKGPQLAETQLTETWAPPSGCTARAYDGSPLVDQLALPDFGTTANNQCVEAPMMGFQAVPSEVDPETHEFGQTVNGNYGFATSDLNLYEPGDPDNPAPGHDLPLYADLAANGYQPQPLRNDDYILSIDIPEDGYGRPMYQVTREEDVNVYDGDAYLPQQNFPATASSPVGGNPDPVPADGEPPSQGNGLVEPCVGPLHTVDVMDSGVDGPDAVYNPEFAAGGGSPFEGAQRPLCTDKLVTVRGQQAVAPTFYLFTEVPLPTHFWGITINDLGLTFDPTSINFGEAQGIPNVPTGIYDWKGRLVDTVDSDANGFYEALEPSTGTYNCPLPAGPCPQMYRFVGNDPGQFDPNRPNFGANENYNPRFRTIATNFQAWPGLYTVTDTAPTQVASTILTPGATDTVAPNCDAQKKEPQIYAVDRVVIPSSASGVARRITITGDQFGNGTGTVSLARATGTASDTLTVVSWSNKRIVVEGPSSAATQRGARRLSVRTTGVNGRSTVNGITIHVLGTGGGTSYSPRVLTVGTSTYPTIQSAIDAAPQGGGGTRDVVLVPPGRPTAFNPTGAWMENVVVNRPVQLQGFGPGGPGVRGSVIDGRAFAPDGDTGTAWLDAVDRRPYAGPTEVPTAATVTVLGQQGGGSSSQGSIDGFLVTGGSQSDFAGNVNAITGAVHTAVGADGALVTQGGGIYVHAAARGLTITNNVIRGNSGAYGGGVRIGTPYAGDLNNDNIRIGYNRFQDNGGTNLAGAIGIFSGTDSYLVDHNVVCGSFSAEYGGAMTQYGRSNNGTVDHNQFYFNSSYDEGGALMIAGELPADPSALSPGSGAVTVTGNQIMQNLANDDGGGLRLLQVGNFPIRIDNNVIADNVSTHEGGGVALDDATNVQLVNNTVMNNLTTATAITSNGQPAAAGLSTARNSDQLQATLPTTAPTFSKPVMFNNIFWDNRAGTWTGTTITGIGLAGSGDIYRWDMGATDGSGPLSPRYSVLQTSAPGSTDTSSTNRFTNPRVDKDYDISVAVLQWRGFPAFRQTVIVTRNLPASALSDYSLKSNSSPAVNLGVTTFSGVNAPTVDIVGVSRSRGGAPDAGAYER